MRPVFSRFLSSKSHACKPVQPNNKICSVLAAKVHHLAHLDFFLFFFLLFLCGSSSTMESSINPLLTCSEAELPDYSSSMDRTLATVELLELILLAIDVRTLLTSANRVCQHWNHVIQQSFPLQTALFFQPIVVPADCQVDEHFRNVASVRTNPLLRGRFQDILGKPGGGISHDERLWRPEASWRRMLLQQPSAQRLGIWRLDTGLSLFQGFASETEVLDLQQKGEVLTMEYLVNYAKTLPKGYAWEVVTGDEKRERLVRERESFFVIKSTAIEKQMLYLVWASSDVVVVLTRWLGGVAVGT